MIKSLSVWGLNERKTPLLISEFNEDLNLLTGKNGCGKTTVLKILWYVQSGHFATLFSEIEFEKIELSLTDAKSQEHQIQVSKKGSKLSIDGKNVTPSFSRPSRMRHLFEDDPEDYYALRFPSVFGASNSIFLPTFRRIEGGFGIESTRRFGSNFLTEFSERLSYRGHKFVSSISTEDISNLVNEEYAKRSEIANKEQQERYKTVEKMKGFLQVSASASA